MNKKTRIAIYSFFALMAFFCFLVTPASHLYFTGIRATAKVTNDSIQLPKEPVLKHLPGPNDPLTPENISRKIISVEGGFISLNRASLVVPAFALLSAQEISITALAENDLQPMAPDLLNVTATDGGYRFLPHGLHFQKDANVLIGYDESLIPDGYTPDDILTYYFDEASGKWTPLEKTGVNTESREVISTTTHFTDMINGIIRMPMSPPPHGYTPTTMKDMEIANPSKGITMIDPPQAHNGGGALLTYPINLPPGRLGMQPQLNLTYSSEGGNGWLGVGWSLLTPFITIDTRWGAPRYNAATESETYILNGEQLSPVAHRGAPLPRIPEKQFYPRVENDFHKIIRHGSGPKNYWWEVTDKSGLRSFYGGHPATGLDPSSILTDAAGNIAHWALTEKRDLSENFIRYHYKKAADAGISSGTVMGYQLYVEKISYTGHVAVEGKYSVQFKTSRDLNEAERKDVLITARLGFKQVTADLLRRIDVRLDSQQIRSYELSYREGPFYKTLLEEVIEFDAAGKEFYRHGFDYYDEVRTTGAYQPLQAQQPWQSPSDDIRGDFINPIPLFNDDVSALGGNKSAGGGGGLTVTVGVFDARLFNKSNTAGASFGFSKSKNEGLLQLIDINGDGLPDKFFKKNGRLFYRPNESGPSGQIRFGASRPITGASDFDKGSSSTIEGGIESNFLVYAGLQFSQTKNERTTYLSDVNGDMLVDIVSQGTVLFNRLDAAGNPVFSTTSASTPNPIFSQASLDQSLVTIDSAELAQQEHDNPLHDAVRIWRAPYDGVVSIDAPVRLVQDTTEERQTYQSADGVRVAIQHNGNELWNTSIEEDDYSEKTPTGVNSVVVSRDDHIYFRVQSVYDGAYDQVDWSPVISYDNHSNGLNDANGLPLYQFNSESDFLATAEMSVGFTFKGAVQIEGAFEKPQTSDDIVVQVVKNTAGTENILWEQHFAWDTVLNQAISLTEPVDKEDELYFRVRSSTNIDWNSLNWSPHVYYISSDDAEVPDVTNSNGDPIFNFYPVPHYQVYNKILRTSGSWIAAEDDTLSIVPKLALNLPNELAGDIVFSIKKENALAAKETISFSSSTITGADTLKLAVTAGERFFLEYHASNDTLWNAFATAEAEIFGNDTATVIPGVQVFSEDRHQFGAMYRHWGQFVYNGNDDRAVNPINEADLIIPASITEADSIDLSNAGDEEEMQELYDDNNGNDPAEDKFIFLFPSAPDKAWKGYDDLSFVTANILSASRMGEDDLKPISQQGSGGSGSGATAIKKLSRTRNTSVSAGLVVAGSYSRGNTVQLYDYMDMNGDRFPDILSKDKIQYTVPTGGLEATAKTFVFGEVEQSKHYSLGLTKGGTFLTSGRFNGKTKHRGNKSSDAGSDAQASGSLSGNFFTNYDSTFFAWLDINGDDLPDRLHSDGRVELNLGYSFAPAENWGFDAISEGNTLGYGGGIGINIGNYSISAGVGLQRTENNLNKALRDVNGDGLPDYVIDNPAQLIADSDPVKVSINTGNGFAAAVDWIGAPAVSEDMSTGESANGAFCACIPITPVTPVAKICFNPSVEFFHGVNRETAAMVDINGDGFPDFLKSKKDDELSIRLSSIGKTNLLRSVRRPLGASFVIEYNRAGNTYGMPHSIWNMTGVKIFDGVPGNGADTMYTTFKYNNGLYNRNEREFFGFGTVITREHDTQNGGLVYRNTVKQFDNSNFYEKGLLLSEHIEDGQGNKYRESLYKYQLRDIHTGVLLPAGFESSNAGEAFPALVETRLLFYEGQATAGKSSVMLYDYDRFGNLASYTDFGDASPDDDYTSRISYHSLPNLNILNIPDKVTVMSGADMLRKQEQDIDPQTGSIIEIRNYYDFRHASVYNMAYDNYGNLSAITRPANERGHRLTYNYDYDPVLHSFITKVSDSYGYSSSIDYDLRYGQAVAVKDINNQVTRYTLDNAGRIVSVLGPNEASAGLPFTIAFDYHPHAAVPWAITQHYDPEHPDNYIETAFFIDGLTRPLQLKKDGALFNAPNIEDKEVMLVSGFEIFDAFGRTVESYYPVTEEKGYEGIFNTLADVVSPTKTTFDILDRVVRRVLPDGALYSNTFDFGVDRNGALQFSKATTDANGIKIEDFFDVRGRISATKKQLGQSDVWTSYSYNAVGELIVVTDNEQNAIIAGYDWHGRRTRLQHPDAGVTHFKYNDAGLLTEKLTANLQGRDPILYAYEFERLVEVSYPENPHNNVKYHYGEPGAQFNRAGRIVVQQDATGAQEFFYSASGEIVKNLRTIMIPSRDLHTYTTEWSYDTWNRLQSITYPDGEIVYYEYNTGGLLTGIQGQQGGKRYRYVMQTGYDKFGQKIYHQYGNGTETFYDYESQRRRLSRIVAETAFDRKMMDNSYTYDNERNVTGIINAAIVPGNNQMGGSSSYQFTYDGLYRLVNATGSFNGAYQEQRFSLSMKYSSAGNILQKLQQHEKRENGTQAWLVQNGTSYTSNYQYSTAQPHTPIVIGQRNFAYDANGNQQGWNQNNSASERTIRWDEENRVRAVIDDGSVSAYTYDADGERVIKVPGGSPKVKINGREPGNTTGIGNDIIYLNQYVVITSKHFSKHYYTGEERVATSVGLSKTLLPAKGNRAGKTASVNVDYNKKEKLALRAMEQLYVEADAELPVREKTAEDVKKEEARGRDEVIDPGRKLALYFYHPDHAGNASFITDWDGEVFQHIEYFPFGEAFVEEHRNTQRTPYLFNAKELDAESGLYYYGARYYDNRTQLWQSADPLMEDYPSWSPYHYTFQNPVNYTDPDGREPDEVVKAISGLGFVRVARDYFEGFTSHISYSFDQKVNRTFWSGGPVAMKAARDYAESNESITLEMTSEGQRLEKITNTFTELADKQGDKKFYGFLITENFWKQLSKGFATGASGKVSAVLKMPLRKGNIYLKDERPLLNKNMQGQFKKTMSFKQMDEKGAILKDDDIVEN